MVAKTWYNYVASYTFRVQNARMAKKKAKAMPAQLDLESPQTQSGDRHKYPLWGLRLPPRYKVAMDKVARKNRRKTTEEVKIALENHFMEVMGEPLPFDISDDDEGSE